MILLIFFKDSLKSEGSRIRVSMDILGYASFLLNISACTTCFIILDRLGDVPYRAAQQPNVPRGGKTSLPADRILRVYGIGALWRWAIWHCKRHISLFCVCVFLTYLNSGLICFLFGFWTVVAQILLSVWIQASHLTAIVASCLGVFCLLPCIAFVLAPAITGLSNSHAERDAEKGEPALIIPHRLSGVQQSPSSPNTPLQHHTTEVYRNSAATM